MKAIILFLLIGTALGTFVPLSPGFYSNFISPGLSATRQYLVYNVGQANTGVRTVPTAVFANGRPTIAHLPTTYNYYGTPIYDFRFPFNAIPAPGLIPSTPGQVPKPQIPEIPKKPQDDDDGIEKLDEKVEPPYDPLGEAAGAMDSEEVSIDNDSVTVEAA